MTFWSNVILIDDRELMMDYPYAKFGDFIFNRFGFIVRTNTQNNRRW